MPPSSRQPPIGTPSNPRLSRTTIPVPEEATSPPPTLAALVASSEPDSPPLRPSVPEPHAVKQLLDMLRRTLAQIAADEAGPAYPSPGDTEPNVQVNTEANGEDHEAEELGEQEGEGHSHPLWNRREPRPPMQYFRAFASAEEMRLLKELEGVEAELLARKVARQEEELAWLRAEVGRGIEGDGEEQLEDAEAGSSDSQDVVVKVVAEVLEDDEDAEKEQRKATSTFFEPAASAAANRSVLPFRASFTVFGAANVPQRSIVRSNRPPPLNLKGDTPRSEGLAQQGLQQAHAARAAFERRRALDPSWSITSLHYPPVDDQAPAQQGCLQWSAARATFQQWCQYEGPSACAYHGTLTPRSEDVARRGREQWWAAQTAHHSRVRAERYRFKDAMSASESTGTMSALVDVHPNRDHMLG